MSKIIMWVLMNGATVLGIVQSVIKVVKELLTGVVNLLSIFMPISKAESLVMSVRNFVNIIDGWVEKVKGYLIPKI